MKKRHNLHPRCTYGREGDSSVAGGGDTRKEHYGRNSYVDRQPAGEKLLTKGEVALMCRVETRTVDRWFAAGKIVGFRTPSGRLLFRKEDVLVAIEAPRPLVHTR